MEQLVAAIITGGASVILIGVAVRSRRNWDQPAAKYFTALAASLAGAALSLALYEPVPATLYVGPPLLLHAVPAAFAAFAFAYTGRYSLTSLRRKLLFGFPVVYMFVNYWIFTYIASRMTGEPLIAIDIEEWEQVLEMATGPTELLLTVSFVASFVGMLYFMGLLLTGVFVLVGQLRRYEHLGTAVAGWLTAAVITPWLAVMFIDSLVSYGPFAESGLTAVLGASYLVSAGALGVVSERYGLFTAAPAAGAVGSERVLEDLPEPVLVVDHDERIIRRNPAAERSFECTAAMVGDSIESTLGYDVETFRSASTLEIEASEGQRHYEPRVSAMTSRHGRHLGYTVVLTDVTDRVVRQQRLEVLNRIIRHNLRNDMTVIKGRAALLAGGENGPDEHGDCIVDTADDLVALGERAQEIERMLSVPVRPDASCELSSVVDSIVEEIVSGHEADISTAVHAGIAVACDRRILRPVIRNLVENAVVHNDRERPTVAISATIEDGTLPVVLSVTDDGPGLPVDERRALERGTESQLEHGSGLGLWGVKWGVTRIGGTLSISNAESRGTRVEIELPRAASPATSTTESVAGDAPASD